MKPQKKAVIGRKATKTSVVAKKRRISIEKPACLDLKKDKRFKKLDKPDELKKKFDSELKKKKVGDERKKEKLEKVEEKKQRSVKEDAEKIEQKYDKMIEKKLEEKAGVDVNDDLDKKKSTKLDEKIKCDKLYVQDIKKKPEKFEEEKSKFINGIEDNFIFENKIDERIASLPVKKRLKEEHKKREAKLAKLESKDCPKISTAKDNKPIERKKSPVKEVPRKPSPIRPKKEPKAKPPSKKNSHKKTVLATKKNQLPIVKKLISKKPKLVKSTQATESIPSLLANVEITKDAKGIKKKSLLSKGKNLILKKLNEDKSLKIAKLPQKNAKTTSVVKKEEKVKNGNTEKNLAKKKSEPNNELDKIFSEIKKSPKEQLDIVYTDNIKKEIIEDKDKELIDKIIKEDIKKGIKSKTAKKNIKKLPKYSKLQIVTDVEKSNKSCEDNEIKQLKISGTDPQSKHFTSSMREESDLVKINLKIESKKGEGNTSISESDDSDEDYARRNRSKNFAKKKERTPSEERAMTNRMKLFGFWSGPKRHRVASLNALAKVHCLYENENGGVYLGGFCKPKPEKEKDKDVKARKCKEEKEDIDQKKEKKGSKIKGDETLSKRKLRNVPGLRGKHYDIFEALTSSSSSDEDLELRREREKERKKKEREKERLEKVRERKFEEERERKKLEGEKEEGKEVETVAVKKPKQTRRKKNAEIMDLKDMVVCKRMASLNASAILAASYSDEKNRLGTSTESSSSSESDVEFVKRRRQSDSDADKRKQRQAGSDADDLTKPSKKVVIVNQDTDVTITGVYVNQTRSTLHEGFCSIGGMQYRISSTSHTQTAATAVATELHEQKEQPCKSYTPLGALSSMQPPGSQGNHSNMSPRRHSAFSAPHQHGYYQPAGPLIQHPSTLQPVKGPPPDPTPTPPQNSEGSDDLVATSTTSGGTSSTGGGFYRTYCPQYYATPPQYQELCYPPSYAHSHSHPPPYYHKYAPPYRRQYYGYQESGAGGGPGGSGPGPGVVEYQPSPGEYLPPYYGGYPPPPPPPPPPPNPAYLHSQGRPFVEHAFQSCPCPMQSCPKNADTGPLIGNGKGAPVISGPGLSLPPSALVGPPSPARGLAGLAPPHGANAWDTDRVQLNPAHRGGHSHSQQQQSQQPPSASSQQPGRPGADSLPKGEKLCTEGQLRGRKCACSQKGATSCGSGCEVKLEQSASPISATSSGSEASLPAQDKLHHHHHHHHHHHRGHQHQHHHPHHHTLKLEKHNVKCESCGGAERRSALEEAASPSRADQQQDPEHVASCRVKCEAGYKCELLKCEQCLKEAGQLANMEIDKDSGILEDDAGSGKNETDTEVKEELSVMAEADRWKKPDYEPTVYESVVEDEEEQAGDHAEEEEEEEEVESTNKGAKTIEESKQGLQQSPHHHQQTKCPKVTKRKLSLDSLSDVTKLKKVSKRTLSVGSPQDCTAAQQLQATNMMNNERLNRTNICVNDVVDGIGIVKDVQNTSNKKSIRNESQCQKRKTDSIIISETQPKKLKCTPAKTLATENSIMETIDNVIQQSIQMSQKSIKRTKKAKSNVTNKIGKKKKKNGQNLLLTLKRASKKLDLVKVVVTEKVGLIRNEIKNSHQKINKLDAKLKSKVKNVKTKKVKAKLLEIKSKVFDAKNNNNNKLSDLRDKIIDTKNNKLTEVKNKKILEVKNNKMLEAKNHNKCGEVKSSKLLEAKNDHKIMEVKNINKLAETKNNKIVEAKNIKNRSQDAKESKDVKDTRESKDLKDSKCVAASVVVTVNTKETKVGKLKECTKKGKLQEAVILESKKNKKKGKYVKKAISRRESVCKIEEPNKEPADKCLTMPKRIFFKPKWSNGWSWEGGAFEAKVYLTNEESAIRRCYVSMRHESGDILRPLDCVLLKSGPRKADLPFVAKIAALWENPDDGEMMFSLLWYYRPEHTEQGRTEYDTDDEVFASRHRDANSVACIEDKCYILTFNEYCRYRKNLRRIDEGLDCPGLIVPPGDQLYPREARQPPIPVPQDMVLFCRRVYDYRGKKLVKNPG